jgi:chemotaxis response regulator CheB
METLIPNILYLSGGSICVRSSPQAGPARRQQRSATAYLPNIDITMEASPRFAGPLSIGVILTGMETQVVGASAIISGGMVLAQDEATSVIFGSPEATKPARCRVLASTTHAATRAKSSAISHRYRGVR